MDLPTAHTELPRDAGLRSTEVRCNEVQRGLGCRMIHHATQTFRHSNFDSLTILFMWDLSALRIVEVSSESVNKGSDFHR